MKFRLEQIEVSLINNSEFRPGMNAFLDIFQLACVLDWAEDNCKNLSSPPHGRFELFTVAFAFLNPPQRQIPDNGVNYHRHMHTHTYIATRKNLMQYDFHCIISQI